MFWFFWGSTIIQCKVYCIKYLIVLVNKGASIGGVLGGIATTLALAGAFYLHWKQRRV